MPAEGCMGVDAGEATGESVVAVPAVGCARWRADAGLSKLLAFDSAASGSFMAG